MVADLRGLQYVLLRADAGGAGALLSRPWPPGSRGGIFVIEAFVPDVARFDRGQRLALQSLDDEHLRIDAAFHDPLALTVLRQMIELRADGIRLDPVRIRYAWPSELDLMARLAGLRLRERWRGWRREVFTADSERHVSVYALA